MQQGPEELIKKSDEPINFEGYIGKLVLNIKDAKIGKKKCCCFFCCCQEPVGAPDFSIIQGGFENKTNIINDSKLAQKKLKILFNPSSGGGNCLKFVNKLKQQLVDLQDKERVEFVQSQSLEHFKSVVQEYDYENQDYVLVICGGDGSICNAINYAHQKLSEQSQSNKLFDTAKKSQIANSISNSPKQSIDLNKNSDQSIHKKINIGILGGGTANDICCCLKIDPDSYHIEKLLKSPILRRIDVGKITYLDENKNIQTRVFINHVGIGYTGRILQTADSSFFYKMFFREKYKIAAIREAIRFQTDIISIEDENGKLIMDKLGLQFLSFNNIQTIGKVYRSSPFAQIDDGIIDLVADKCDSSSKFIESLEKSEKDGLAIYMPESIYYRGRKFKVIFEENTQILAAYDGELITCQGYLEVQMIQDYVNLIY